MSQKRSPKHRWLVGKTAEQTAVALAGSDFMNSELFDRLLDLKNNRKWWARLTDEQRSTLNMGAKVQVDVESIVAKVDRVMPKAEPVGPQDFEVAFTIGYRTHDCSDIVNIVVEDKVRASCLKEAESIARHKTFLANVPDGSIVYC